MNPGINWLTRRYSFGVKPLNHTCISHLDEKKKKKKKKSQIKWRTIEIRERICVETRERESEMRGIDRLIWRWESCEGKERQIRERLRMAPEKTDSRWQHWRSWNRSLILHFFSWFRFCLFGFPSKLLLEEVVEDQFLF